MKPEAKTELLKQISEEVKACNNCRLSRTRTQGVPGEGSPESKVLFVGEGPGVQEDLKGRPFCGPAGKFLDEMLESIELDRSKVFITNIVKCRPPGNRDPEDDEKDACWSYLERQIEILKPKLIITLGRHSMSRLLPGQPSISKIHGKPFRKPDGRIYLPLYHPSAALHNGSLRPIQLQDFKQITKLLEKITGEEKDAKNNLAKQKLF